MRGATGGANTSIIAWGISIHTPHAGSDDYTSSYPGVMFISIHTPHAGSDAYLMLVDFVNIHFNPHSPCGERRLSRLPPAAPGYFNPHSPCGERPYPQARLDLVYAFQSTLPMRGATIYHLKSQRQDKISIHTPHAGSDQKWQSWRPNGMLFQSTLPMRGATRLTGKGSRGKSNFNPHSPCGERLCEIMKHRKC